MIWFVVLLVGVFIVLPATLGIFFWNKSFVHRVRVAIQTGEDPNDVVWKDDRFKVLNQSGHHTIVFKWMKGGAQSPPGNLWTKFLIGDKTTINFDAGFWKTKNLPNKIQRGLYLYRTLDGQFHPMTITKQGDFRVLTQDNRNFLINADREAQKLMMTGKQQMLTIIAVVLAIVVLGVCFILFLVYLGNNTDKLCGLAQVTAQSGVVEGVQTALGG